MRRIILAVAVAVTLSAGEARLSVVHHHLCTLIALPWDAHTHVPAPPGPAIVGDGGATFQVTYTGFTTEAQAAFQRAVDIWAGLVSSPVPIRINAQFTALGPGVLGSAGATCFHRDFSGAPVANTWYPQPMVDRFAGMDVSGAGCGATGASFEINASFSNTFNWYYGLDGATPGGRHDFVSVALHEIGHGLGFLGFGDVTSGEGTVIASGFPGIWDRFTETESGVSLLTGFTQPSAALGTQLTHNFDAGNPRGPGVYFDGTHARAANGGQTARLYTVTPWSDGSSYSHLDESTYAPGHADSLMTPFLAAAEAIHHPGNVGLGMFKDMGWSTCPASLASSGTTIAGGAGSGSVALTIEPNCAWTATSQSGFLTITSATSGTGNATVTFSAAANTTGSTRQGTLRISGATYTVTQNANSNTVAVSPATLYFAGTNTSGTLSPLTPAQAVVVTAAGSGSIPWTASASASWLQVSPTSGTGSGVFTVSIVNPGNVLAGVSDATATITIASTNAGNTAQVTVHLSLRPSGSFTVPFGQVDTPAQNAAGVQGAIGVTGWALDDVGVSKVEIYRNCLGFDNPASCQTVLGTSVVYIGDAAFLAGARPDVEGAFATTPISNRAGWGYLMLTPMLPHVPSSQVFGGQGPLTLHAIAVDIEGNRKRLGRTFVSGQPDSETPTQITMDNATIAKPFGAIDTPGQGATVSGNLANFGWALTPDSNTTGGEPGDIVIPTNGSTMTVFIDNVAVAQVTFNQCRGTNLNGGGSPFLAPGVYCNDDVASIFGHPTPQAPGTTRTSNPTRYRNLDAGRGVIGSYDINTTAMTNGLHTIAWSVTDSAGRTEGIGSRFFHVVNSGADAAIDASGARAAARVGDAATVETLPSGAGWLWGRVGYDTARPWVPLLAASSGVHHVQLAAMDRLELWLGASTSGAFLVANGELRPLPVGATLDGARFIWAPPLGYRGDYRLAFIRLGQRVDVVVHVR